MDICSLLVYRFVLHNKYFSTMFIPSELRFFFHLYCSVRYLCSIIMSLLRESSLTSQVDSFKPKRSKKKKESYQSYQASGSWPADRSNLRVGKIETLFDI